MFRSREWRPDNVKVKPMARETIGSRGESIDIFLNRHGKLPWEYFGNSQSWLEKLLITMGMVNTKVLSK